MDGAEASSRREIGMARKGNNCGVLLKKIAAMFKFSLSALLISEDKTGSGNYY